MTEYLVSNEKRWRYMTRTRRSDVATWLRMNGVDPGLVPTETSLTISSFDGSWSIEYEEMITHDDGSLVYSAEYPDMVEVRHSSVELVIPPPSAWLTELK